MSREFDDLLPSFVPVSARGDLSRAELRTRHPPAWYTNSTAHTTHPTLTEPRPWYVPMATAPHYWSTNRSAGYPLRGSPSVRAPTRPLPRRRLTPPSVTRSASACSASPAPHCRRSVPCRTEAREQDIRWTSGIDRVSDSKPVGNHHTTRGYSGKDWIRGDMGMLTGRQ